MRVDLVGKREQGVIINHGEWSGRLAGRNDMTDIALLKGLSHREPGQVLRSAVTEVLLPS